MRVLVTGGHGFVGSHLVRRLLERGDRVRCLLRRPGVPEALRGLDVEVTPGDVRDAASLGPALDGIEEVHHLAALTRSRSRREILATNVGGTENLLAAALRARLPGRFVLCSSLAAAGPAREGRPLDEASPCRPVTWYGESKLLAERLVRRKAGGVAVTVVRPPAVYGPRDRDFLPLFRAAARGLVPALVERRLYHLVYVEDLADAFVAAARSSRTEGRTYFAAHPCPRSPDDLAVHAARALGREARFLRLPFAALGLVCRLGDLGAQVVGSVPLLNGQRRLELAGVAYLCRSDALAEDAGWWARVDVPEGAARTVRWYVDAGWIRGGAVPARAR